MNRNTRPSRHRALILAVPAVLLLSFALPASLAEAAPSDKLLGKWKAVAMESGGKRQPVKPPMSIVFHFKSGGKFQVTMSYGSRNKVQKGTWSATASVLTMTIKSNTETAKYKITGAKLTMSMTVAGRKAKYYMKKIP